MAVYPGSFDPVTLGHLDIIERVSNIFDKVIVAVSLNPAKNTLFSVRERVEMLKEVLEPYPNVEVDFYQGLTIDYSVYRDVSVIIRGLRVISDFEYELKIALINKKLTSHVETLFLMTKAEYMPISSTSVKEVALFGGSLKNLVPPLVEVKLKEKSKRLNRKKPEIHQDNQLSNILTMPNNLIL